MKILYVLEYYKLLEGHKEMVEEVFHSLEDLLSSVDEYCLKPEEYTVWCYSCKEKMSNVDILTAFSEEIGMYDETD